MLLSNKPAIDNERLTKAVIESTQEMFKMFALPVDVTNAGHPIPSLPGPHHQAEVRFSRSVQGWVQITLTPGVTATLAQLVFGPGSEDNQDQLSQVAAEVANMVAGGIRNQLQSTGLDFDISLPFSDLTPDPTPIHDSGHASVSFCVNNHGCSVRIILMADTPA